MSLAAVGFTSAQLSTDGIMYVAVKELQLKSSPAYFSNTNGTLSYGDSVIVLQVNGEYAEVQSISDSSLSGWTASASLASRQIKKHETDEAADVDKTEADSRRFLEAVRILTDEKQN